MKLTFSRNLFADGVFQAYNTAVKHNEYKKISYTVWGSLRDYLYLEAWTDFDVVVERDWTGFRIYLQNPCEKSIRSPESFFLTISDDGFGRYLFDNWEKDVYYYSHEHTDELFTGITIDTTALNTTISNISDSFSRVAESASNVFHADTSWLKVASADQYITKSEFQDAVDDLRKNIIITTDKEKENEKMKFGNFDFGPVDSSVHMSLYGMAIKNASGTYVAYDKANKQIMDVDILNFEGANKFIYKMPVALRDVRSGDVIIHARKPMFVQMVGKDGRLKVLDIYDGEEKTVVPATNPFGFNFVTKVISLINLNGAASVENPFGGMLPLLMMSGDTKTDDMLPMALMMGGGMDMSNPMMMWALMGNHTNDPMMLAMAMGAFNNKNTCDCKCGSCSCENSDK
jgi:hypothetical protein